MLRGLPWLLAGAVAFSAGSAAAAAAASRAEIGPINLPQDVGRRLARCWVAPGSQANKNLVASVRLSFRSDGSMLGPPLFTYVNAPPGSATRADVTQSIREALTACTPLPFTAALGSAIAGRTMVIRFIFNPPSTRKETAT